LVIPDQPGKKTPLAAAEDAQKLAEIKPATPLPDASADGTELQTEAKPHQPRTRLRAAIRAVYNPSHVEETEPEDWPVYQEKAGPEDWPVYQEETDTVSDEPISIPNLSETTPISGDHSTDLAHFLPDGQPEIPQQTAEETLPDESPPIRPTGEEAVTAVAPVTPEKAAQPPLQQEELERAARAQALIAKAQAHARKGQLNQARQLFGMAIQQEPTNAEAWTWLGGLLADINLERAKICLTRAVELDATNERANRGLAQVNSRIAQSETLIGEVEVAGDPNRRVHPSRAIVLVRPEEIKVGLEEIIEKLVQSGIDADPESIPLGGARIHPAREKDEFKPYRVRRSRLAAVPAGVVLALVFFIGVLVWLGPLSKSSSETPAGTSAAGLNGQAAAPATVMSADASFALNMRLEIDKYNRFFLTARNLRQQIQSDKIGWEEYRQSSKQLQANIKNEKKSLDNLALQTTPRLIQFYRELQNIATISNQAVDFTMSGIENTSPEDLEEGNRQFNETARRLGELLRLLNQQVPLAVPVPAATPTPGPAGTSPATPPTASPTPPA
jgi:tetratricopeptide (TPR) repeat protein